MLALFDPGVEILMIAFALIHYDRHGFCSKVDFNEPPVLIAIVISDSKEVGL